MLSNIGNIKDLKTARKYKYFFGHFNFAKKQLKNTFSKILVHKQISKVPLEMVYMASFHENKLGLLYIQITMTVFPRKLTHNFSGTDKRKTFQVFQL